MTATDGAKSASCCSRNSGCQEMKPRNSSMITNSVGAEPTDNRTCNSPMCVSRKRNAGSGGRRQVSDAEVDEARFAEAQRVVKIAALRGTPLDDDDCANCLYYLEPDAPLAFCRHEKVQILVGAHWWCHFWEMPDDN